MRKRRLLRLEPQTKPQTLFWRTDRRAGREALREALANVPSTFVPARESFCILAGSWSCPTSPANTGNDVRRTKRKRGRKRCVRQWAARERGTTRNKDRERTGNLLAAAEVQPFHILRKLQLRDVACSGRKEGKKGRRSEGEERPEPQNGGRKEVHSVRPWTYR